MRRKDKADPQVTAEQEARDRAVALKRYNDWNTSNQSECRRRKAGLPEAQWQAWLTSVEGQKRRLGTYLEGAGFTVSRKSIGLVLAGVDKELDLVTGLREDGLGIAPDDMRPLEPEETEVDDFGEGDMSNLFPEGGE